MSEVNRFACDPDDVLPDDSGEYVTYHDHTQALAAARSAREKAEQERDDALAQRNAYMTGFASAANARVELEMELADLHDSIRTIYRQCPQLPICAEHPEDFDAATDTLHSLCLIVGIYKIDVRGLTPSAPSGQQEDGNG